ncbi:MAG TPA: SH3 domain-containing protein [Treponemataceae bacterium]|nr:SH3 domain-containing protein [Treponemataceae bacterium]
MEKSGRRRTNIKGSRLLILALALLLPARAAFAFDADIRVSSYDVVEGETVRVEIVVRGASPAETAVEVQAIPDSFVAGASSKERASVDATSVAHEWKATERGTWPLGPFEVRVKGEAITLPPAYITVSPSRAKGEYAALRWVVPVDDGNGQVIAARTGVPTRIVLEASLSGKIGSVSCPAPENALLEARLFRQDSVKGSEPGWIPVGVWDWTPLADGTQELPRATLEYADSSGAQKRITSESRSIAVSRASTRSRGSQIPRSLRGAFSPDPRAEGSDASSASRGNGGEGAGAGTEAERENAERLRSLRRAEYRSLFPQRVRAERLALEEELGLGETFDVPPAAWKPFAVIGAVVFVLLALVLRLMGSSGSNPKRFLTRLSIVAFACALSLAIFAVSLYTRDVKTAGVSLGVELLHVPETSSTVVERLRGGTPLRVRRVAGEWLYVETPSSLSGWIPSEAFLEYTVTERAR